MVPGAQIFRADVPDVVPFPPGCDVLQILWCPNNHTPGWVLPTVVWRNAGQHPTGMFPYLPQQSGYRKRLRGALGLVERIIRILVRSSEFRLDNCWIVDSTPVPCGRSRPTVKRSEVAGWAGYGCWVSTCSPCCVRPAETRRPATISRC